MLFSEALKVALQSLWANKMRTVLTTIGVVISVASLIAVITLGNGAKMYVVKKIANQGSDVMTLQRINPVIFTGEEYLRENKRKNITYEDYEYLRRSCTRCLMIGAELSTSGTVVNGKQSTTNTTINGWTPNMVDIENLNVVEGRELTPMDEQTGAHNAIVGYDIVDNLLPNRNPIGQELRVDGEVYTVVGVGERKGAVFGQSEDNYVDMPLSTYLHTNGEHESLNISAKAGLAPGALDNLIDEVRALMRAHRHDRPGEEDDFAILTNETFIGLFNQITGMFAAVILGIASISLVVGGVVIMNIMLVSVTERVREIGLRKALGATQRAIRRQFLVEASVLGLAGGILGAGIGLAGAVVLPHLISNPITISPTATVGAIIVAVGIGIVFGVYPATRAARLAPIDALRGE